MKPNIYIGYASIPIDYHAKLDALTLSQRQRFNTQLSKATDNRKRQFCTSRILLNHLSQHYFSNQQLRSKEPLEYPYQLIDAQNHIHSFNISHSGNWVVVAIADADINNNIGVDIQTLKPNWTPQKARFFCSQEQVITGFQQSLPDQYFSQLWSQKEAYFKATQAKFVNKKFTDDNALFSQTLNIAQSGDSLTDMESTLFLSLYCATTYEVSVKQWHLF